jgi:hypothetical protein
MRQSKQVYILYNRIEKEFVGWDYNLVSEMFDAIYFDEKHLAETEKRILDEPELFDVWSVIISFETTQERK